MLNSRVLRFAVGKRGLICRLLFTAGCKINKNNHNVLESLKMLSSFEDLVFNDKKSKHYFSTVICEQVKQQCEDEEYEAAIRDLNALQSNAETIRASIAYNNSCISLEGMRNSLHRSGLSLNDLDQLSVIHVSGTKGKGSTCALTEAILRSHGYKTGFFSSPHLVSVTERIRINGQCIDKKQFTRAFRRVYQRLQASKEHEHDMPAYFKFLTILCFHIFLEQEVDVCILEVGIGGEYDCTNIVRNTKTVGITSLGLEHTNLLGNTLSDIAYHKAGIIKPQCNVYTSVTQPECLEVIQKRAAEQNAMLHLVPNLKQYLKTAEEQKLYNQMNEVMQLNSALAIELAFDWLRQNDKNLVGKQIQLTKSIWNSLLNCCWPGRCQLVKFHNFNIYLDGAHTIESLQVCSSWFVRSSLISKNPKILIFNTTGDRDSKKLLEVLYHCINFDLAFFVPNITSGSTNKQDNLSTLYGLSDQIKRAKLNAGNWHLLRTEAHEADNSEIFASILDCFSSLQGRYAAEQQLDVLVTGSLHLIGATVLALNEFKKQIEKPTIER